MALEHLEKRCEFGGLFGAGNAGDSFFIIGNF